MQSPLPVLEYDNLPARSGITLRREEDGTLVIDVPRETLRNHLRWAVRSPRIWTLLVTVWVSQTGFILWQSYHLKLPIFTSYLRFELIGPTLAGVVGFIVGALLNSRWSATIQLTAQNLSISVSGPFSARRREWERALICDVRASDAAVIMRIDRPEKRKPRKVPLIGNREPAELAWIAKTLRNELMPDASAWTLPPAISSPDRASPPFTGR